MAREKLDKEINIIEIVKSWRYFENAFKFLLPEGKRIDLKERARYLVINPDPDQAAENKKAFNMMMKRTQSIRRHNMSDGFFSSEEIEDTFAKKSSNNVIDLEFDQGKVTPAITEDGNQRRTPTPLYVDVINLQKQQKNQNSACFSSHDSFRSEESQQNISDRFCSEKDEKVVENNR